MDQGGNPIEVYLEIGKRRTFAAALNWPGWCRGGGDEAAALQALWDHGQRYERVVRKTQLGFQAPADRSAFTVVERLKGNASTDFGAPNLIPRWDTRPIDPSELRRLEIILKACWQAFDASAQAATGKALSKGPRGGGRELAKIVEHVRDANAGYLSALGGKWRPGEGEDASQGLSSLRRAILPALVLAAEGGIAATGPRGGKRWPPRYFVRRHAWHELDHAWEIEDRMR